MRAASSSHPARRGGATTGSPARVRAVGAAAPPAHEAARQAVGHYGCRQAGGARPEKRHGSGHCRRRR
eukprot:521605-Pyramimonas_sp.AAC.1